MGNVFRLFVYGTLKEGGEHHHLLSGEHTQKDDAQVAATRYSMEDGIPYITVPKESILLKGSIHPMADAKKATSIQVAPIESETWVDGELYVLTDPEERVPLLDLLEDFEPGGDSEYDRVLLPVKTKDGWIPAWTYIIHNNTPIKRP